MQSIERKILTSVAKRGRGKIIFPQDFASYGPPNAIHKAFGRLVASDHLLRVAQGVYCYPKIDKVLGLGILYPTVNDYTKERSSLILRFIYRMYGFGDTDESNHKIRPFIKHDIG